MSNLYDPDSILDVSIILLIKFITDTNEFILRIKKLLRNNAFEDNVQNNEDYIGCVVSCAYNYKSNYPIRCDAIQDFLNWFENATKQSQELILANIISKLSFQRHGSASLQKCL